MAQSQTLKAQKRTKLGTKASRALRAEGRIPANIQGDGVHLDFSLEETEFLTSRRKHIHLYDLDIDGEMETAVVRELQWDTFGDKITHIEFRKVIRGVKIESEVALEFYGHPESGILNQLMAQITVNCIPSKIPDSIRVRVDKHAEGDHILASELEMPEDVELAAPAETELATIVAAKYHVDTTADEAEAEEGEEGEGEAGAETPETPEGEGGENS